MQLNKDLREFIELLNSENVEYLVVGAFAVVWHGHPRFTSDIDFWVRCSAATQPQSYMFLTDSASAVWGSQRKIWLDPTKFFNLARSRIELM